MLTTSPGTAVFLAPPSPPSMPHLGTAYTWCLLDAAARDLRRRGGTAVFPESWNLSSRRLDRQLSGSPSYQDEREQAVAAGLERARIVLADFGVAMTTRPAVRDDDPEIRSFLCTAISELVSEGVIRRTVVAEKWCDTCAIAMPVTAVPHTCFHCRRPLTVRERADWFLRLNLPAIFGLAEGSHWLPPYAKMRFRALTDINPHVRVGHFGRVTGIPSPLDARQKLDPRLVAALYPRILRNLGFDRIVTAAGHDIQRKWLVLVFATAVSAPAIDTIINHGVLLADERRKMSRYDGATVRDLPAGANPVAYRAALLAASLGRDIVASVVAFEDASRLRAKVANVVRFLEARPSSDVASAVNLEAELGQQLQLADDLLGELDFATAYRTFRRCVWDLSHRVIPDIRAQGCRNTERTVSHLRSIAAVFYGDSGNTGDTCHP